MQQRNAIKKCNEEIPQYPSISRSQDCTAGK